MMESVTLILESESKDELENFYVNICVGDIANGPVNLKPQIIVGIFLTHQAQ